MVPSVPSHSSPALSSALLSTQPTSTPDALLWCCLPEPSANPAVLRALGFGAFSRCKVKLTLSGLVTFCGHLGHMVWPLQPHTDVHMLTDPPGPQSGPFQNQGCLSKMIRATIYTCAAPSTSSVSSDPGSGLLLLAPCSTNSVTHLDLWAREGDRVAAAPRLRGVLTALRLSRCSSGTARPQ